MQWKHRTHWSWLISHFFWVLSIDIAWWWQVFSHNLQYTHKSRLFVTLPLLESVFWTNFIILNNFLFFFGTIKWYKQYHKYCIKVRKQVQHNLLIKFPLWSLVLMFPAIYQLQAAYSALENFFFSEA